MKVTTYQGTVENGQIKLPANIRLPEKTKVYVVIPDQEAVPISYIGSPRLVDREQEKDFQKEVIEESADANL